MSSSGDLRRPKSQQAKAEPRVQPSETDLRFIRFCREFAWGKIELLIKDGRPTMATVLRQDFRFDIA